MRGDVLGGAVEVLRDVDLCINLDSHIVLTLVVMLLLPVLPRSGFPGIDG